MRQKDLSFAASTVIEFSPTTENEEAGLTIFQRRDFHYDLCVTRRDGTRVIVLRKTVGDMIQEAATMPAPDASLELRVIGSPDRYYFAFRTSNGEWQEVGSAWTKLITAEVAETWSGVFIGLYSAGNGSACQTPADFDWFTYREIEQEKHA